MSWNSAKFAYEITPSDDENLELRPTRLYVGNGGKIKLELSNNPDGEEGAVTLENIPDGTVLELNIRKIWATGTDASNLIGILDNGPAQS